MNRLWKRMAGSLSIAALATTTLGCHLTPTEHASICKPPPLPSTVTTGGLFAQPKTIAIGPQGLSLGDAVEAALRPGLTASSIARQHAVRRTPGRSAAQRAAPTVDASVFVKRLAEVASQPKSANAFDEAVRLLASDIRGPDAAPGDIAGGRIAFQKTVISFVNDHKTVVTQPLEQGRLSEPQRRFAAMIDVLARGDLGSPATPDPGYPISETTHQLLGQVTSGVDMEGLAPAISMVSDDPMARSAITRYLEHYRIAIDDEDSNLEQTIRTGRIAQTIESLSQLEFANANRFTVPQTTATTESDSQLSRHPLADAVVSLSRAGDAKRWMPLSIVRSTPVGDILLEDRDRVEIEPFDQTTLGKRKTRPVMERAGTVELAGLVSARVDRGSVRSLADLSQQVDQTAYRSAANLMRLSLVSPTGKVEEYWFPRTATGPFSTFEVPDLRQVEVRSGDLVEVDAIELNPQIRRSRIRTRMLAAEAIEKRRVRGVLASHGAAKPQHDQQRAEPYANLPGISVWMRTLQRWLPLR